MSEIINFKRWKKDKARQAKEKTAAENRATSSISAKKKKQASEFATRSERALDGHKLEKLSVAHAKKQPKPPAKS